MSDVSATDMKVIRKALAELPGRIKTAQEKEMGDMMGKLKEVRLTRRHNVFVIVTNLAAWKWHSKALWSLDG
jgi:hypothetical protein